jgi:hypothetical protein
MNNEAAIGKASKKGKYYNDGKLPPKRKVMYDLTNEKNKWEGAEILEHYKEVVSLLTKRQEILGIQNSD